jgi:hypothetical protein
MGWQAAFEGRWHQDWAAVQQKYYEYIGSRRTGKRWLVAVITKLWDVAWDLWMDRNGENTRIKVQRARVLLEAQVSEEYSLGYDELHMRKRRLFTEHTLEERLCFPEQALESWLLRVAAARRWAELDPGQVQHNANNDNGDVTSDNDEKPQHGGNTIICNICCHAGYKGDQSERNLPHAFIFIFGVILATASNVTSVAFTR